MCHEKRAGQDLGRPERLADHAMANNQRPRGGIEEADRKLAVRSYSDGRGLPAGSGCGELLWHAEVTAARSRQKHELVRVDRHNNRDVTALAARRRAHVDVVAAQQLLGRGKGSAGRGPPKRDQRGRRVALTGRGDHDRAAPRQWRDDRRGADRGSAQQRLRRAERAGGRTLGKLDVRPGLVVTDPRERGAAGPVGIDRRHSDHRSRLRRRDGHGRSPARRSRDERQERRGDDQRAWTHHDRNVFTGAT